MSNQCLVMVQTQTTNHLTSKIKKMIHNSSEISLKFGSLESNSFNTTTLNHQDQIAMKKITSMHNNHLVSYHTFPIQFSELFERKRKD